jgi:hypothetical protein
MKIKLISFILIASLFLTSGCGYKNEKKGDSRRDDVIAMISSIDADNINEIYWEGSYLGIHPHLSERAKAVITQISENDCIYVYDCLSDARHAVFSHIVLSLKLQQIAPNSTTEWNGLRVDFSGQIAKIPEIEKQKEDLKEKWSLVIKKKGLF